MTLLEYLRSFRFGCTTADMLAEITEAHEAKHTPFLGLPADAEALESGLRLLANTGLAQCRDGVWSVREKVTTERSLF